MPVPFHMQNWAEKYVRQKRSKTHKFVPQRSLKNEFEVILLKV